MANTYVNKVVINGVTKLDLTGDTIAANKLLTGYTAHDKSGAPINGACTFDADTSDGTISPDEVLSGEVGYAAGAKITGTMPNRGAVMGTISSKAGQYTVPQGYHDGSGKVGIDSTEQGKLIAGNIKKDITILGVTGTYGGETIRATSGSATPTFAQQTVLPPSGYDYLTQVTVSPIPVTYTDNAQGGQTCTVG